MRQDPLVPSSTRTFTSSYDWSASS